MLHAKNDRSFFLSELLPFVKFLTDLVLTISRIAYGTSGWIIITILMTLRPCVTYKIDCSVFLSMSYFPLMKFLTDLLGTISR